MPTYFSCLELQTGLNSQGVVLKCRDTAFLILGHTGLGAEGRREAKKRSLVAKLNFFFAWLFLGVKRLIVVFQTQYHLYLSSGS